MARLSLKCPICRAIVELSIDGEEIQQIEDYIQQHGKSPTYGAQCKNGHALAALVSVKSENGEKIAYLRDVYPLQMNRSPETVGKTDSMDWVLKHFGGK